MKQVNKLPPAEFSNLMNDLYDNPDFTNWQKSTFWKIFKAGYKYGIEDIKHTNFDLTDKE